MSHQRNGIATPKDEWCTPAWLFDLLDREFHFDLDVAATSENYLAVGFYDKNDNALERDWVHYDGAGNGYSACFLNPPYSAGNIDKFMAKALEESQKGAVVVCLVPCATDTRWWHNYAMKAQEIRFIKGRVRFVGYDEEGKQIANSPTFSSCVVIFDWKAGIIGNPVIGKTIEQPRKVPA